MREKKSFGRRVEEFLGGKGFYIVLFVCVAVIGVSAWLLLFSQYSPMMPDDAGDYLDVMGNIDVTAPTVKPTAPVSESQPEHSVPAPDSGKLTQTPNEPKTDSALVVDKDKGQTDGKTDGKTDNKTDGNAGKTVEKPEDVSFIWPLSGSVAVGYSPDELIFSKTMGDWRVHNGVDLTAKLGTKVLSAAAGTVTKVEDTDDMGTTVTIDHGAGVTTTYANLAGMPTVKVGDSVTMGAVIGSVGATALYETGDDAHLHFEMAVNGENVDPGKYLPKK